MYAENHAKKFSEYQFIFFNFFRNQDVCYFKSFICFIREQPISNSNYTHVCTFISVCAFDNTRVNLSEIVRNKHFLYNVPESTCNNKNIYCLPVPVRSTVLYWFTAFSVCVIIIFSDDLYHLLFKARVPRHSRLITSICWSYAPSSKRTGIIQARMQGSRNTATSAVSWSGRLLSSEHCFLLIVVFVRHLFAAACVLFLPFYVATVFSLIFPR